MALARRIAEAKLDLRRILRARQLLAQLPEVPANFRLVPSPNSKLFMAAVRRANRRKNASMNDFTKGSACGRQTAPSEESTHREPIF
ncbi:hypothetical protein QEV83_08045 [Methylocapsa sp. D3K7]|uniref:hypothetical protein n=1 Tax=Methylocapsa sp. D3K7 TaxID=3041435 RepID=UPI00244EC647|nr:hypothetical protein [Methylocapsa sp. D3K7]WGJ16182.1 hypothetical protein QEV83_08045 [Methylocapsa sp. D3K7]